MRRMGKESTVATYQQALNSLMRFRQEKDMTFDAVTPEFIAAYEAWMQSQQLCRNTTSFYMRILRSVYNKAVKEQLTADSHPFGGVYTGIDKTARHALSLSDIRQIRDIKLPVGKPVAFARDMFMLSFYLRGMAPVDLAFLRKSDLSGGILTYTSRITGSQTAIRWEQEMQQILDRHPVPSTRYLLPLIQSEDGSEMRQYRVMSRKINRALDKLTAMLGLPVQLNMNVARHSWESIASADEIQHSIMERL